jgi:signal peptidase I
VLSRPLKFFRNWILPLFLLWLGYTFVGTPARINGSSMSPTLEEGEAVWMWKWPRFNSSWPDYGEVVATLAPLNQAPYSTENGILGSERRTRYVKRVVGKPGDTLELREGELYRNGAKVPEKYTSSEVAAFSSEKMLLEPDQFYVLGDNRRLGESIDSRFFGPVTRSDLLGQVSWVFWPPSSWGEVR